MLGEEKGSLCDVLVDEIRLEHATQFKYLGCVLDETGKDVAESRRKVPNVRKDAGATRTLVKGRSL